MKSKILTLILVLTLILSTTSVAMAATTLSQKPVSVVVNGTAVQYNDQTGYPFKDGNNRVQVPFRQTLEAFGAEVEWNQQTNTAIAKKGNVIVEVPIGVNFILKDGKQIANDTVAVVQNGKTYLPIRVVFESFDVPVKWDEAGQSVVIGSDKVDLADYDEFISNFDIKVVNENESMAHLVCSYKNNSKEELKLFLEENKSCLKAYSKKIIVEYYGKTKSEVRVVYLTNDPAEGVFSIRYTDYNTELEKTNLIWN